MRCKLQIANERYDKMVDAFEQANLKSLQEVNTKQIEEISRKYKGEIKALELGMQNMSAKMSKENDEKEREIEEMNQKIRWKDT